jgi:hypothetical protein
MLAWLVGIVALVGAQEAFRTETLTLRAMTPSAAVALHGRVIGPHPEAFAMVGTRPDIVIVHDTAPRLRAFKSLLNQLDQGAPADRTFVRPTVYRDAAELAAFVVDVHGDEAIVVADPLTQHLVIRTSAAVYARIDALLRRLDRPARDARTIRVTPAPEDGDFPP